MAVPSEYGPFAEVLRATGPMAMVNPFRFSTKYQDDETGLLYYGYRYYSASTGRWLSRDPIGEKGGVNLYGFVRNDSVGFGDAYGMSRWRWVGDDAGAKVSFDWRIKRYASGHAYLKTYAGVIVQWASAGGEAEIYGHYGYLFPSSFYAKDEHSIGFRCDPNTGEITIHERSHLSQNPPEASAGVEIADVTMLDPHTVTGIVKARVALKFSTGASWTVSIYGIGGGPSTSIGSQDATLTTRFVFKCKCVDK